MYGIVNQAIQDLVVRRFGESTWEAALERAGHAGLRISPLDNYPDSLTFELVGSLAAVLEIEPGALLREFGRSWVEYTDGQGFGSLLEVAGETFEEALRGLDTMHVQVTRTFRSMKPPRIVLREGAGSSFEVEYHSEREGLEPMMAGLLEGLARRFGLEATVEHRPGEGCVLFHVSTRPMAETDAA